MELGGSENVGIYAEAKSEYTRQLSSYLVHALQKYFIDFLDECKQQEPDSKKILLVFQQGLEQIPDWNQEKVQRETQKVIIMTACDYLEELLTAVFIAHTKVLSAIRLSTRQKKLQITIPKLDHFIHKTFIECARLLWTNAYLFASSGSSIERQKNMRQIEQLIQDGVLQAIRGMLPVKNILKEYLRDDEDDEGGDETTEPVAAAEAAPEIPPQTVAEPEPVLETAAPAPMPATAPAPAPAPMPATTPAPVLEEVAETTIEPIPVPEKEGEAPPPQPPTIIIDTSNPAVNFTNINTVFDTENGDNSTMDEADDDELEADIQILDDVALPMEDFEEL